MRFSHESLIALAAVARAADYDWIKDSAIRDNFLTTVQQVSEGKSFESYLEIDNSILESGKFSIYYGVQTRGTPTFEEIAPASLSNSCPP